MNGKRILIALLALAVALLCGAAALAESTTVTQDGVTVKLDYTCKGEDGAPHTSHASITNVKITRTNVNRLRLDVSFRTYCDQNPNHGESRNTWYSFGRNSCTLTIRKTDRTNEQDFPYETRVLDITVDGVPHKWIGGRCIVCNSQCIHADSTNQPTCTQSAICSICGNSLRALGHDVIVDPAVEPACLTGGMTEGSHCGRCQTVLQAQKELPALGHDYQTESVKPTCEVGGYLCHTCTRCGDTYTENTAKKLSHWFGEWIPNADDTHSAPCLREGCKHTGKVDCQKYPYVLTIENQEDPFEITLCPVCGELTGGARLELEEKAQALAETESLPAGELVLRLGETEGVSLLSVAFEFGGRLTQPEGQVRITLPAAAVEDRTLMLLDETSGETELPVEIREEEAAFLLDFTPREGEEPSPVRLIRLIPNP